jgi:transposase
MDNEIILPEKPQLNYKEMSQAELAARCERQDKAIAELTQNVNRLIEMIRLNTQRKFGTSGDSVAYPEGLEQLNFFNEAEATACQGEPEPTFEEATAKTPRKPKQKGKREQDFRDLTVTVIEHELPAEQQVCPVCVSPLHDMKVEVTRTLKLVPAHFEVEEHRRHVYTCRACEKTQGEGDKIPFVRADMPNLPIPGSFATPELIAGIINSKYTNAMPLARIEREFDRMDSVRISRQNMSNWILQCSEEYFSRIHSHMKSTLLSKDVLHADETWVKVVQQDGRESKKKCYMWVYCSGAHDEPIVYYEFHESRASKSAKEFFKDYAGYLHSDGYEVYHRLGSGITVVGCLAHIKRKFTDAIKALSPEEQKNTVCFKGQEYCDYLFHIEKKYKDAEPEERHRKRLALLKPVMDAFLLWLKETKPLTVPKSQAYDAVNYALNQWPYFENILLDGRLDPTNNLVERNIRPFTIGRKNWVTMKTDRGAHDSSMVYSIILTALANDLKVYDYLVYLLKQMPNTDFDQRPELIGKFVPWSKELPANCYKTKK